VSDVLKVLSARLIRLYREYSLVALRALLAFVIAVIVAQFPFDYVESLFYDGRMRLRPPPAGTDHIVTIAIDAQTIDHLRRSPNANDHRLFLEKLAAQRPLAIVYLIEPSELVGGYEDLSAWATTASQTSGFYIAVDDVPLKSADAGGRLPPPFEKLTLSPAPSTSDKNLFAQDFVTRRMFVSYQSQTFLHAHLAAKINTDVKNENNIRGLFELFEASQVYVDFRPAGRYPRLSFIEILEGSTGAPTTSTLAGKIVIVGRDLSTTAKDYIRTPYSRQINAMTTMEMHANFIDTLIRNDGYVRAPSWLNFVLTLVMSLLSAYVVLSLTPTRGLKLLGAVVLGFSLIAFLLFWWGTIWVTMAHPLLTAFICYYFFIPYRLIVENRRSWEYYQKNRLLTQVEELKTNFLSMMSHDLKTPLARIQGMTEVVLNDPNPLSARQREALVTLEKSSQELLSFFTSILNLGRIESKRLELHLHSKDPNQLVREVIQKYEYLASSKNIEISAELEPVFSIKMDVDLIRQVIGNLIENAIKYSPEGSRVLISTEEREGYLVIQVADQGMGIPEDEVSLVFSKFYRSKNAKTSDIKGSGLGLYLAKYFVELHKGRLLVDSSVGQGSTFTVELPTDLKDSSASDANR